jgi:flagellar protein FlaJ
MRCNLLSLKEKQPKSNKKEQNKLEKELPYFITFVTLLATSGFGPYTIFQKIKDIELLPTIRIQSERILKRIEILGTDPISAINQAKDKTSSKSMSDFLGGYVSAIEGGGDVVNYLKSKMNGAFDVYAENEKQKISKVKAVVESYMTIQIVILAVYIIFSAVGNGMDNTSVSTGAEIDMQWMLIVVPPTISAGFIFLASKVNDSFLPELPLKQILLYTIPLFSIGVILISLGIAREYNAFIMMFALVASAIFPMMKFKSIYKKSIDAENSTPKIMRDIAEARKAGTSPEKCVIRTCKRKDYKLFSSIANSMANKLEWGIQFEDIFLSLKKEIKDFQVLINFKILFEIISGGGGNVHTLIALADVSEKIHNIEKTKRSMLKPYVMVGFILIGITGFTTLIVIDSLTSISIQSETDLEKISALKQESKESFELYSIVILIQAWLAGIFLGRIVTGTYSGGFQYSIMLVLIAFTSVILIQSSIISIGALF